MDIITIWMIVLIVVALFMILWGTLTQRSLKEKQEKLQKEVSEAIRVSLSKSFPEYFSDQESPLFSADDELPVLSEERISDRLKRAIRTNLVLVHYPSLETKADIQKQVDESVSELKKRIEAIEARFPQEATLEKISSINDAILATQLEAISNSIKTIQDNMLTKWDVVKIVFTILLALGGIAAIIFGIVDLLKP
jgi:CHAD domain-containing protein